MKKGFTLIELLAVIVVLAIIALIAVPVVLNIINDAKESSLLRSAEFYLDAVEYTIADAFLYHGGLSNGQYPITEEGNICKKALPCDDANILKVEVSGEKPTGGSITIDGGKIVNHVIKYKNFVVNNDEDNNNSNEEIINSELNHNGIIPDGGVYTKYVNGRFDDTIGDWVFDSSTTYDAGNSFPTISEGDMYVYGDYTYRYGYAYSPDGFLSNCTDGWSARHFDKKESPGAILETINGQPLKSIRSIFSSNINLTVVPKIPSTVTDMWMAFEGCNSLTFVDLSAYTNITNLSDAFAYRSEENSLTVRISCSVTDKEQSSSTVNFEVVHFDGCGH